MGTNRETTTTLMSYHPRTSRMRSATAQPLRRRPLKAMIRPCTSFTTSGPVAVPAIAVAAVTGGGGRRRVVSWVSEARTTFLRCLSVCMYVYVRTRGRGDGGRLGDRREDGVDGGGLDAVVQLHGREPLDALAQACCARGVRCRYT